MEYTNFYEIATYLNEINRNIFSQREVAENAHIYCVDFQWSKENDKVAHSIKELAKLLAEDGSEQCKDWLYEMAKELGLLDMDYMDYMETDADIVKMFLVEKDKSEVTIVGIIFQHGEDDYGLWEGFMLSEKDDNAIQTILSKYETDGCSVRGTRKDIAEEMGE